LWIAEVEASGAVSFVAISDFAGGVGGALLASLVDPTDPVCRLPVEVKKESLSPGETDWALEVR
jgi:hypothetical protein